MEASWASARPPCSLACAHAAATPSSAHPHPPTHASTHPPLPTPTLPTSQSTHLTFNHAATTAAAAAAAAAPTTPAQPHRILSTTLSTTPSPHLM